MKTNDSTFLKSGFGLAILFCLLNAGCKGPEGPQGPAGTPGTAGTPGATGPQGVSGVTGPVGASGVAGPIGNANVQLVVFDTPKTFGNVYNGQSELTNWVDQQDYILPVGGNVLMKSVVLVYCQKVFGQLSEARTYQLPIIFPTTGDGSLQYVMEPGPVSTTIRVYRPTGTTTFPIRLRVVVIPASIIINGRLSADFGDYEEVKRLFNLKE